MKKIFVGVLVAALMCMTLVGCAVRNNNSDDHTHSYSEEWTSDETYHWHAATCEHADEISGKDEHKFSDGVCTDCGRAENVNNNDDGQNDDNTNSDNTNDEQGNDNTNEENAEKGYKVTFVCGEHVAVYVYETQDMSGEGEQTATAYSRDGETGELVKEAGTGQVNVKFVCDSGYEVYSLVADDPDGYDNIKDIGDGVYRITKIESDLNFMVNVQTVGAEEDLAQGYKVTFVCDEHVTVYVYKTQDSDDGEQTETAYSRDGNCGWLLKNGGGQVNYELVFDKGYGLDGEISITAGYKNHKSQGNNVYRITKITADLTVTIDSVATDTEEDVSDGYEITFNCGEHATVYVYETQDMSADGSGGEAVTTAYSRLSSGEISKAEKCQINFVIVCDEGYEVTKDNIVITGNYNDFKGEADTDLPNGWRITKIASDLTVSITATEINSDDNGDNIDEDTGSDEEPSEENDEYENAQALGVTITCESGTEKCFTVDSENNVITFGAVSASSVYSISGELNGQIVINTGDDYKFELSMQDLTVTNDSDCPIVILSGDEVTLSAKSGTENYIYDKRASVLDDDTAYNSAVYSLVDLNIQGNGNLTVISDNNKGIHTKDDLEVKNLTLYVKCADNALKGNDSVTVSSGTVTLIATGGDCIKTSTTTLSSKGKQKGTVTISGGTVTLYAACDGIDAAYDVEISGDNTVLNIYTDKYSEYTGEVLSKSTTTMYLRMTSSFYSSSYRYAVYFYNSSDDYTWADAEYYTSSTSGGGPSQTTYYYFKVDMPSGYTNVKVYCFTSSQTENSTSTYNSVTSGKTINTNYDMFCIASTSSLSWSNYSSSSSGNQGGMGNMGGSDGNSDKSDYSCKGIKADNEIKILGGTINIQSHDDAIHCDYGTEFESGVTGVGIVTVSGGTITILTLDDAIHSDYKLIITGGKITVTSSYEGLEGNLIEISGGEIYVYATDDGINAAGSYATPCITVSGGYVDVTVSSGDCDGIDSNGNYVQTGGFVISRDPTTQTGGMASGLDIDGTCTITSGTFICVGAIAETPTNSECWVKFNSVSFTSGTYTVKDSSGNVLFTFMLNTSYKSMWIASNSFSMGNTYTVTNGSTTKSWTQSSNSVTVS